MGNINPIGAIGGLLGGPAGGAALGAASGGKGGDAPSHPDFAAAATPNQTNAFGANSQWSQGPDGKWNQQQSFGGPLGDAVKSMGGQAASAWGTPLDNGQQARTAATNSIYGQETSRLDPMWQQQQHALNTDLANQGIDPNSEAYAKAQGNFGRNQNDAYQQAMYGAITGGGQEAQRQQGMDLASRFAPLQGLGGMAGLTGQSANPLLPAAIAQYQGDLTKYGINQEGKNSTLGALASLGGSAMKAGAACDERLKEDIVRYEEEMLPGVPMASFRYKWEPPGTVHVGVIAQDLGERYPDLVTFDENGYRMVPAYLLLR